MNRDASSSLQHLLSQRERWRAFLLARVRDPELADDLLQDSLLKALRKADSIREKESSVAWFYRVLRNAIIDHARSQTRHHQHEVNLVVPESLPESPDQSAHDFICGCLKARLDALNPRYAELIRKVDLEEITPAEVARSLGQNTGTLHVALHRARQALREELISFCGSCAEGACLDCHCDDLPPHRPSKD